MTELDTLTDAERNERAKRKFLFWIGGFFALFIVVDITFWILADNSHSGVVSEEAYNEGLRYNERIAAAEQQGDLGWVSEIYFEDSVIAIDLEDAYGNPIMAADVRAEFTRPTQEGFDMVAQMEYQSPGRYETKITLPLDGVWDVRVFVKWNDHQYQDSKRIEQYP